MLNEHIDKELDCIKKGLHEAEETLCKKPYCDGDCSIQKAIKSLDWIKSEGIKTIENTAKIKVLDTLSKLILDGATFDGIMWQIGDMRNKLKRK